MSSTICKVGLLEAMQDSIFGGGGMMDTKSLI